MCVWFKSGEEKNIAWGDRSQHLASTKSKLKFLTFKIVFRLFQSKLLYLVHMNSLYLSSDLNLHFQPIRFGAEKSQPSVTVKTIWVSWLVQWQVKLVQWTTVPLRTTQQKQRLSPLLGCEGITVWFTGHFSLSYSFLGTSIKALWCYGTTGWKKKQW